MSDENKNTEGNQGQEPVQTPPTVEELQAEVSKWKALSRQNETRWNEASKERDDLKAAQMTEAEKAIETAKNEGRTSAYSEVGSRLVEAELKAAAATAGATLPNMQFLNTSQFVGADGLPVADQINAFVSSLPKANPYSQDLGLGRQGSPVAGQLTQADLSNMTPAEINKARSEGKLDALLRGDI